LNPKLTAKERGLIKGALRRIFARSDLHRKLISNSIIPGYSDISRPRVKKWSYCSDCRIPQPTYLIQLDHIIPIIGITETLDQLSIDELVDRLWCDEKNLKPICKACHSIKSKAENKLRREYKKSLKKSA